jgi:hypothetical protein
MKLDEIDPEHFGTLNKADLLKKFEAPTLGAKAAELEAASKDEVKQATKKGEKETGNEQFISKSDSATTGGSQSTKRFVKSSQGSRG